MTGLSREADLVEALRVRVLTGIVKMARDLDSEWFDRLVKSIADAPLIPEQEVEQTREANRTAQVLVAASYGLTTQMTADLYGLSHHSVREYLERARRQLGAKTTLHAVAIALRKGLIK